MSYPSYPSGGPGYPAPQGGGYPSQPGYPPQPQAGAPYPGGWAPYPGAPPAAGAPYPGAPGQAAVPYPSAGGPPQPSYGLGGAPPLSAPYPGAPPAAAPYPGVSPGTGSVPPAHGSYSNAPAKVPTAAMAAVSLGGPQAALRVRRNPSVRAASNFNKEEDVKAIQEAMKGCGCDEKAIISIICKRSNAQRVEIRNHFKTMCGKDLVDELKKEMSGLLEAGVLAMMRDPIEYDAYLVRRAMRGAGTDESTLIEILCSRTNAEKQALNARFRKDFGNDLEKAIKSETCGHFLRLLVSLSSATRDESEIVDLAAAKADAQKLYQAGEAKWGTDESIFNKIMASRNFSQLRATFDEYSKISKCDISTSISREMSGDLKEGMLAIVHIVRDTPGFFASRLYKSMKGAGVNDETLIRVCVTRCEVDMEDIKTRFQLEYRKSLRSFIEGDTSGNYKRFLLSLINDGGV